MKNYNLKILWFGIKILICQNLIIVVPGGFSYGNYLRSGKIAEKSNILNEVIKAANEGCFVLGICNGFQILTETGKVI